MLDGATPNCCTLIVNYCTCIVSRCTCIVICCTCVVSCCTRIVLVNLSYARGRHFLQLLYMFRKLLYTYRNNFTYTVGYCTLIVSCCTRIVMLSLLSDRGRCTLAPLVVDTAVYGESTHLSGG